MNMPHTLSSGEATTLGQVLRDLADNQESLLKMIDRQQQMIEKLEKRIRRFERTERQLSMGPLK